MRWRRTPVLVPLALLVGAGLAALGWGLQVGPWTHLPVGVALVLVTIALHEARPDPATLQETGDRTRTFHGDQMLLQLHRHRMAHKISRLESECELQRSVFEVASELLSCRNERDALQRFSRAVRHYWKGSAIDLLIWERGQWRRMGVGKQGEEDVIPEPPLGNAIHLPTADCPDLVIDLSPAVAGQAALVVRAASKQPSITLHDDADDGYLADVLRGLLTLSLRRVMLHQELQRLGRTDPLTTCYRRWYGQQRLEELVADGLVVAVAMVDIDYFKRVNDDFGHAAGDQTLKALGELLRRAIRKGDFVYRYGGEEFVVVLPETSPTGATQVAERIRARTASLPDLPHSITVSIGVACCHRDEYVDDLIARADAALYEAKAAGRDRVVNADSDSDAGVLRTTQRRMRVDRSTERIGG